MEQNVVGVRRIRRHTRQLPQRLEHAPAFGDDLHDAALELRAVTEHHARDGLRHRVDRIRLTYLYELADDLGVSQQVSHAHARKRERLGKRAQDDQVLVVCQVRAHRAARKLEVRLVHHHQRIGGVKQTQDEALVGQIARGVVRAGDDDVVDVALRHARKHRFLVDGVVGAARHVHHLSVRELGIVLIHGKRRRHVQELAPRPAPGKRDVEQQLVAAVAHKHLVSVKAVCLGDHVAQLVGKRIGVAVERHLVDLALYLVAHLGFHVRGVLVGRQVRARRKVLRVVGRDVGQLRG